jgi:hypothetical protein
MQLTLSRQPTAIAIFDATFARAMPRELSDLSNRENTVDGVDPWQWRIAAFSVETHFYSVVLWSLDANHLPSAK